MLKDKPVFLYTQCSQPCTYYIVVRGLIVPVGNTLDIVDEAIEH